MERTILTASVLAAVTLLVSGFLIGGRYIAVALPPNAGNEFTAGYVVVIDRFTGAKSICGTKCRTIVEER
jgi:hypothetical protein